MNYFDYQPNLPMGRIWSLFTDLASISEEEVLQPETRGCAYSHTLEIVKTAMKGSISISNESLDEFNLRAYEFQCKSNDDIETINDAKKCLFIVDDESLEGDGRRVGFGDVSSRKLKSKQDEFEGIENLSSFESSLNELLNIRNQYITTSGVDLVSVLKGSLRGIPDATELLAKLTKGNEKLSNLILDLCDMGDNGLLLQRLVAMG